MAYQEATRFKDGKARANFYQDALRESAQFRKEYTKRKGIVKAKEMPWEDSPQGQIKHVVNGKMNTRECALDLYQQQLSPGGCSGKHRHLAEEVFFVLEGKGYDLHWDVNFTLDEKYNWEWATEPKRFEWEAGDFVYIPPYSTHQHFNSDPDHPARIITATNRMIKEMGFDWVEQVEPAPGFKTKGAKKIVKQKSTRRK
jgi:mannose-6-phosphate isomerase-like protein (cupin superfamily)